MDVYKSETREVIKRFLAHRVSFPDCIAALDAALAAFIPRMLPEDLVGLRAVMLANNEIVMNEMERGDRHHHHDPPIREEVAAVGEKPKMRLGSVSVERIYRTAFW